MRTFLLWPCNVSCLVNWVRLVSLPKRRSLMEKCKFGDHSTVGPVRWFRLVQRVSGRRGLTGLEPGFRIRAVGGLGGFSALDVPDAMIAASWREADASSALVCFRGSASPYTST